MSNNQFVRMPAISTTEAKYDAVINHHFIDHVVPSRPGQVGKSIVTLARDPDGRDTVGGAVGGFIGGAVFGAWILSWLGHALAFVFGLFLLGAAIATVVAMLQWLGVMPPSAPRGRQPYHQAAAVHPGRSIDDGHQRR